MISIPASHRPRRNRATPATRNLLRETRLHPHDFIYPLFVQDTSSVPTPIVSMPGVFRHSSHSLLEEIRQAADVGICAFAIFPCIRPELKDPTGSHSCDPANLLFTTLRTLRAAFPDLIFIADVALDPYTDHGHDGILSPCGDDVDNDLTVKALCALALEEARAGASWVAPSDMMDGRIAAIRKTLDAEGFSSVNILSYAAKFASAYYGPFREAVGSKIGKKSISKASYQLDPANAREALLETEIDIAEGADLVMVKPAGPYLDVLRQIADISPVPVCAYQVSGEYAQICAAAQMQWLDYEQTRAESLLAIKRAGADLILSYFALEACRALV